MSGRPPHPVCEVSSQTFQVNDSRPAVVLIYDVEPDLPLGQIFHPTVDTGTVTQGIEGDGLKKCAIHFDASLWRDKFYRDLKRTEKRVRDGGILEQRDGQRSR